MNCPACGSLMRQGPDGGWACGNCGTVRSGGPVLSACGSCYAEVVDGPEGGYVCGACGHTEEPPARVAARRARQRPTLASYQPCGQCDGCVGTAEVAECFARHLGAAVDAAMAEQLNPGG